MYNDKKIKSLKKRKKFGEPGLKILKHKTRTSNSKIPTKPFRKYLRIPQAYSVIKANGL
jgi:hypothetical protein